MTPPERHSLRFEILPGDFTCHKCGLPFRKPDWVENKKGKTIPACSHCGSTNVTPPKKGR